MIPKVAVPFDSVSGAARSDDNSSFQPVAVMPFNRMPTLVDLLVFKSPQLPRKQVELVQFVFTPRGMSFDDSEHSLSCMQKIVYTLLVL